MTSKTKTILTYGLAGIVTYILYKKYVSKGPGLLGLGKHGGRGRFGKKQSGPITVPAGTAATAAADIIASDAATGATTTAQTDTAGDTSGDEKPGVYMPRYFSVPKKMTDFYDGYDMIANDEEF